MSMNRRSGAERGSRGRAGSQVVASGPPAVTPITILGGKLLRWIEIGAGSEQVSSGEVTQLNDLSGNGYHLSAIATQRAVYEAGGWNGRPSMSLDGGNDNYLNTDTGTGAHSVALISGSDKSCSVWVVWQNFDIAASQTIYSCGSTAATTPVFNLASNVTPNYVWSKNFGGVTKNLISPTASNTVRNVHKLTNQGTQAQSSINGVVSQAYVALNYDCNSATTNQDCIGALARNTISSFAKGRFVAQITMTGVPTAGEEAAMDAYLQKFYATASAPMFLINGDSLSTSNNWQVNFQAAYPNATVVNTAVAGQTLFAYGSVWVARDQWSNYDSGRPGNLLLTGFGSNDIVNAQTGADTFTRTQALLSTEATKNPGRKIVVQTIGWRQGLTASEETERQAFNTSMRGAYNSSVSPYLLDRDVMVTSADAGTLYLDGTHLNTAGNDAIWNGRNGATGLKDFVIAAGGF